MKQIKNNLRLLLTAILIACGASACVNVNEVPPQIQSTQNVDIKFPEPPTLTDEDAQIVNQIKREYDENTK